MSSLFDQNDEINPQLDQSKNYLDELVGEGKKFKTVEDLARGKAEADLYIQLQNARTDELREDYLKMREEATAQAKLQDLIDRLDNTRNTPQLPVETPERTPTPQFDPNKLESLIEDTFSKIEGKRKSETNFAEVQKKLKDQYGSNYQAVLKEKMNELDLSLDDVNSLARKSPTAFYNTLGLNQQRQDDQSMPRNSQRSGFTPKLSEKRTWAFYEKMRKENPKLYYDSKTINQKHDDAVALGIEFQDGDFHA